MMTIPKFTEGLEFQRECVETGLIIYIESVQNVQNAIEEPMHSIGMDPALQEEKLPSLAISILCIEEDCFYFTNSPIT